MIDHNFKKKFGQNFISDKNLLAAIVSDAGVTKDDNVLEIGAGGGTLTAEISQNAKKVVSYEIDKELSSHLLSLNLSNATFIFQDVMKEDVDKIESMFDGKYKMIANLPYYITTPIIFKFLNNAKNLTSLTIMVQKEVAQRIVASEGGKDYGVLSVMTRFFGDATITREVGRKMFYPVPNVDSAIVKIELKDKYPDIDKKNFYRFVQACFSMRRKTLKNNLSHAGIKNVDKLPPEFASCRAETLSIDQFIYLYLKFFI